MRSIVVWLIGILLLPGWMGHLYAQMPEPTPTVTLDMRQVPLLDILMELEKQTGLFFSYESSLLKELPEVSLSVRDESLSYCLKRLFSPLPIIYRVTCLLYTSPLRSDRQTAKSRRCLLPYNYSFGITLGKRRKPTAP